MYIEQFLKNDVFLIFCHNFVTPISNLSPILKIHRKMSDSSVRVSFLIKTQLFSCEFCELFINTFFIEHRVVATVCFFVFFFKTFGYKLFVMKTKKVWPEFFRSNEIRDANVKLPLKAEVKRFLHLFNRESGQERVKLHPFMKKISKK